MDRISHRRRVVHGPALRAIREAIGISQTQVAGDVGISASYLTNLEAGRKQPSPELARRLADRLTVDITAFSYLPSTSAQGAPPATPWEEAPPDPRPARPWEGGPGPRPVRPWEDRSPEARPPRAPDRPRRGPRPPGAWDDGPFDVA